MATYVNPLNLNAIVFNGGFEGRWCRRRSDGENSPLWRCIESDESSGTAVIELFGERDVVFLGECVWQV